MRTVFFGTPEIAVPALDALHGLSDLVGVVCQPDRPAGRGLQLRPPPVKVRALELGVPLLQPVKVRDGSLRDWLAERQADVAVVLAYGRILPPDVLATPRQGCLNLHASLLPRHRGAAPIQWALMSGDDVTGISLMQMDEGLDTGSVFSRHPLTIEPTDDAGTLTERLAALASRVLQEDLHRVTSGALAAVAQDNNLATWAPPLKHADQVLSFDAPSALIWGKVRGLSPRPGAIAMLKGKRLKVLEVRLSEEPVDGPCGTLRVQRKGVWVKTASGSLELVRLQREGKGVQTAMDLVNGRAIVDGDRLETDVDGHSSRS